MNLANVVENMASGAVLAARCAGAGAIIPADPATSTADRLPCHLDPGIARLDSAARLTVLMATNDRRLFALDARTGARCAGFGHDGEVTVMSNAEIRAPWEAFALFGASRPSGVSASSRE